MYTGDINSYCVDFNYIINNLTNDSNCFLIGNTFHGRYKFKLKTSTELELLETNTSIRCIYKLNFELVSNS